MNLSRILVSLFLCTQFLCNATLKKPEQLMLPPAATTPLAWPIPDIRLDTEVTAEAYYSYTPQISCSGDHVYACWSDLRNGDRHIYFNYSVDRGATWQASEIRLDTGGTAGTKLSRNPQITCIGDHVYVCWEDSRNGNSDIYFNYSTDRGTTWQASDIRLDTGDTAGAHHSWAPQVTCREDHVVVTWSDNRDGSYDIYANYSADNGATWQATDMRLDTGDTPGAHGSYETQIACSGEYVYVTWYDNRNGNFDIYFNHSTDRGATWQASDIRLDTGDVSGAHTSMDPQIACSENYVYVTWYDYRDGRSDIYFNYSADHGATWRGSDIRLDIGDVPGTHDSGYPQITCSGNHVYVTWHDYRNGSTDIYFNYSTDNGASWQVMDMRLDTGDFAGANASLEPQIACTADHVYVTWEDQRNGISDIYFNATNRAPTARAGVDTTVHTGTECPLDGSSSADPDKDPLTYAWRLMQKPTASGAILSGAQRARPSFTPDQPGEYRFRLTVTDPFGATGSDRVLVTADEVFELTIQVATGGSVTPVPGTYTYDKEESVRLTATADTGFIFSGWSGDASGTTNPLTVIMDEDKTIGAGFTALVYPPQNLSGERIENRSLSMAEHIARLTWSAHPDNIHITGYRVMRLEAGGEITVAVVDSSTFVCEEAGVAREGTLTYRVYAVRGDGHESDPAVVTIH